MFKDDVKIYFVAETKSTGPGEVDLSKLKVDEQLKIKCGNAHFEQIDEVEDKVVSKVGQLINLMIERENNIHLIKPFII